MKRVTLFTREGCHLCDDALAILERVRQSLPFALEVVDLDREAPPDKHGLYTQEVPVVELEGKKLMKFHVDEERLLRHLAGA